MKRNFVLIGILFGLLLLNGFTTTVAYVKMDTSVDPIHLIRTTNLAPFTDNLEWGLRAINATSAWEITTGSSDIIVAVIDTGIDYTHPDLANNIWVNEDEIAGNGLDDDSNGYVDDIHGYDFADRDSNPIDTDEVSHGTHVAGVIAAEMNDYGLVGVAPNVTVMALKVFSFTEGASQADIVEAINYAVANGANIISMSLGSPDRGILEYKMAMENAVDNNVTIVAASGNDGTSQIHYPGSSPNTISVGAINRSGAVAPFSNYGVSLDISAPGVMVNSTGILGSGLKTLFFSNGSKYASIPMEFSPMTEEDGINAPLVYVGLASVDETKDLDLTGKIALIKRGEYDFKDKVENVAAVGAIGAIVFNNEPGQFRGTLQVMGEIPTLSISDTDGNKIQAELESATGDYNATIIITFSDYLELSGTSMATPHVSGVAALLLSVDPTLTPAEVKNILKRSSNYGAISSQLRYGMGTLNASRALEVLNDMTAPTISVGEVTVVADVDQFRFNVEVTANDDFGINEITYKWVRDNFRQDVGGNRHETRSKSFETVLEFKIDPVKEDFDLFVYAYDVKGQSIKLEVEITEEILSTILIPTETTLGEYTTSDRETAGTPGLAYLSIASLFIMVPVLRRKLNK